MTPELDGTILPGVTRDSILTLARQWGEFKVFTCRLTHLNPLFLLGSYVFLMFVFIDQCLAFLGLGTFDYDAGSD